MRRYFTPGTILTRYEVNPNGCWNWKGASWTRGYGVVIIGTKRYAAHRYFYLKLRGEIPKDKVIDHLCRNRNCVNPNHMEIVTNRENVLRGIGLAAINAKKESCKWGHELIEANIYRRGNKRHCKICAKRRAKECDARKIGHK